MSDRKPDTECCPRFDPEPWDEKTFEWSNRKFIRDRVFTSFYMPVNFGPVIVRMNKKVESGHQPIFPTNQAVDK